MKKIALIFCLFVVSGMTVMAQKNHKKAPQNPEERAAYSSIHMQKRFGLDDNQTAKIKSINFEKAKKVEQIRANYKAQGDKKAMHAELKKVKADTDSQYKSVMTPEQYSAWTQARAERHQKMAEHKHKHPAKK
jgi:hypothetical protein